LTIFLSLLISTIIYLIEKDNVHGGNNTAFEYDRGSF